jgi:adenosine kinase
VVVSRSIATDHLMTFPGWFRDQLIEGKLGVVSLSFLVEHLLIFHGGVGAIIALGKARSGLSPILVGAAGMDFSSTGPG